MSKVSVSVCIPAYNEEKNIKKILDGLLAQKTERVHINKIIVISSSTDATNQIVFEFAQLDSRVILHKQEKREGKAAAINVFLKMVDDPIIVIESADTIPLTDTIENLCLPLIDDQRIGMTGGALFL